MCIDVVKKKNMILFIYLFYICIGMVKNEDKYAELLIYFTCALVG